MTGEDVKKLVESLAAWIRDVAYDVTADPSWTTDTKTSREAFIRELVALLEKR